MPPQQSGGEYLRERGGFMPQVESLKHDRGILL